MYVKSTAPTWQLVVECAEKLGAAHGIFSLSQLVREVQALDPSRERSSVQPVIQGMTVNAGKGPASACGKPLLRVGHGAYEWRGHIEATVHGAPPAWDKPRQVGSPRRLARSSRQAEVASRIRALVSEVDRCLIAYDEAVPFTRTGQYEFHRATIDRRRLWPKVGQALDDDVLLELLHQTLQRWGIGRRASRLVPLEEFRAALRARENDIAAFEHFRLDDPGADIEEVAAGLWPVIQNLGIVRNVSVIVPGSKKTLHHLLLISFLLWTVPGLAPSSSGPQQLRRTGSGQPSSERWLGVLKSPETASARAM